MRMSKAITRAPRMISEWCRSKPPIVFFRLNHSITSLPQRTPRRASRHGIDARQKQAQNPLVSQIGTICTYAALPEGSGTVSAHLRRQHKPTVVRCKLEVGMGRAVGKTDCETRQKFSFSPPRRTALPQRRAVQRRGTGT